MAMARIHSRHRDSLCTVCLRLTCSKLMPLSVAELLDPPHTTESSITNESGHFEADPFNIAPTLCQRIDSMVEQGVKPRSTRPERASFDEFGMEKRRRNDAVSRWRTYRIPRAFASAATRSTSARRSDSFLVIQVSQDFPVAVSSPVKAIVAI